MIRRLTLRRADGRVFLDRWRLGFKRVGGVMVHRMDAPDPGLDLHDHPWTFVSIVVKGGYTEERADTRLASMVASVVDGTDVPRGEVQHRRRWSVRMMRLDDCHRITALDGGRCWTVVFRGPVRRTWGFYMPDGWIGHKVYGETVRVERRDLYES